MPSEKSARSAERKRQQNRPATTEARTLVARASQAIQSDPANAAEAVKAASAALDKAAQKGAIHTNNASRRKGRLTARLAKAQKGAAAEKAG